MISKQTQNNMHKGEQAKPQDNAADQARNANPSRQASRGEPSHQKDMHDQKMLDEREQDNRGHGNKH